MVEVFEEEVQARRHVFFAGHNSLLQVLGEVALPFDLFAAVGVERGATGIGHDQGRGDRGDGDIPARAVEAAEDEEFLAVAGFGVEGDIPGKDN